MAFIAPLLLSAYSGLCFCMGHWLCNDFLDDLEKPTEDEKYSALFEDLGIMDCSKDWIEFKEKEEKKGYCVLRFKISDSLSSEDFKAKERSLQEKLNASYIRIDYKEEELIIYVQYMCGFLTTHSFNALFKDLEIIKTNKDWTELVEHREEKAYVLYRFVISRSLSVKDFETKKKILQEKLDVPFINIKHENGELIMRAQRKEVPYENYKEVSCKPYQLLLGHDLDYNPLFWDLKKITNLAIAGMTGMGKSTVINALIINGLLSKAVEFDLVDLKGGIEFFCYKDKQGVLNFCQSYDDVPRVITEFEEEFKRRQEILRVGDKQYRNYEAYMKEFPNCGLKRRVLIFDEWAVFAAMENDKMFSGSKGKAPNIAKIIKLVSQIRFAGMHILICTQRPSADVVDGLIKSQFSLLGMRVLNKLNSEIIIGMEGLEDLDRHTLMGEMDGELQECKAYYLDEEMLDEWVAKIPDKTSGVPQI